jgi:tetratricopeptide (TPR) repeat protein
LLVALSVGSVSAIAQDEEAAARAAEKAGQLRQALRHYVAALQTTSEGSDGDQQLRERIIALAQKVKPAPSVPDEARTHFGRGQAGFEIAKDSDDFRRAAAEFQQALKLAPWLANGYFNLGRVQDKLGQNEEAIKSFKLYLLAAPSASDADDVKTRIAGLEYKIERQQADERAAADKRREEEYKRQAQQEAKDRQARQEQADASNGFWRDPSTGLIWTKRDTEDQVNWNMAANYCRNLRLSGYGDWRLPTINELQGIHDPASSSRATQAWAYSVPEFQTVHVKGNLSLSGPFQWSSSTGCQAMGETGAMFFVFDREGGRNCQPLHYRRDNHALCVRGF